jgi:hypothetical protein
VQSAVLGAPLGVVRLMDLLGSGQEVLRNEALLLLVGLCAGCEEMAKIAAFEGAFERLLALAREEGGAGGGGVLVQDALELVANLLRGTPANARLFIEMGHAAGLPGLLKYEPPPVGSGAAAAAAAAGLAEAAAAAGGGAGGAGGALGGLAAAAAGGAGAAAAALAAAPAMPSQAAANFLVALEVVRLLLAPPPPGTSSGGAPPGGGRGAAQDALGRAGLADALLALALLEGGAPSPTVRAQVRAQLPALPGQPAEARAPVAGCARQQQQQHHAYAAPPYPTPVPTRHAPPPKALLALGDLVDGHPTNRTDIARIVIRVRPLPAPGAAANGGAPPAPPPAPPRAGAGGYLQASQQLAALWGGGGGGAGSPQKAGAQWQQLPALHAALRVALTAATPLEAAAAQHVMAAFCRGNPDGQVALAGSVSPPPGAGGA